MLVPTRTVIVVLDTGRSHQERCWLCHGDARSECTYGEIHRKEHQPESVDLAAFCDVVRHRFLFTGAVTVGLRAVVKV